MRYAEAFRAAAKEATRAYGAPLVELSGFSNRGHGDLSTLTDTMWHDTVTGSNVSRHRLGTLLRDGYEGLPGPIANAGLDRDGAFILVAAGRANHAGKGGPTSRIPANGANSRTFGLEVANRGLGSGERWTGIQYDVAVRFTAVLHDYVARMLGHKEWTSRKVDPWAPDLNAARKAIMVRPSGPTPTPTPTDELEAYVASLSASKRKALDTLLELDDDQMRHVVSFAKTVQARGSSGQGVVNAAVDDARQREAAGFDGGTYQAMADLDKTIEEMGSGVRGWTAGTLALVRQARALGIDASPAKFHQNRSYTVAEAGGALCRHAE